MTRLLRPLALLLVLPLLMAASPAQQQDWDAIQIETLTVADGLYVLVGSGGNIGLSVGEDGAFLVDDQYAPLTDKIRAAVAAITNQEVRFVVNTHWHGDHTGGNENFGDAGAMIVAHENVRKRMNPAEFAELVGRSDQAADAALPVVTFNDRATFHWNGETIRAVHVAHAHTDGDAVIWFANANAVHMGDNFFAGRFPFIDVDSGGSVDGMIAAVQMVIEHSDSETKIIPGHGPISSVGDLVAFRDMLRTVRDRVRTALNDGMSLEQTLAAGLSAEYDEAWGGGFVGPERFVTALYTSLSAAGH
jgi:glyoxylase-like metal-dependent hydrolase (beta-lactamase superfamily II)